MDLLFLFKKGVSIYIHPLTISMELIVVGIVLIGFSRRRRRGKKKAGKFSKWLRRTSGDFGVASVIAGVFFLFLASIKPVADPLVFLLEKQYPPLELEGLTEGEEEIVAPEFIVVLAGGERFDPGKPPTSQLSYAAMARVNEGARLAHRFPESTLVFTGKPKEVRAMTEAALALDLRPERIVTENESRDTKDHPRFLAPILGDSRFFLVTSGTHMPRAMRLFEGEGLEPVAASCDLWVWPRFDEGARFEWDSFLPRVECLWMTHTALHEFLGMAWADLVEARDLETPEPGSVPEDPVVEPSEPPGIEEPDPVTPPEESVSPPIPLPLPEPRHSSGTGGEAEPDESGEPERIPALRKAGDNRPVLL